MPPLDERISAIRALIAAGYTLTPLRGKIPTIKEWENTPPNTYTEKNLTGNYGVVLKPGDLVIDVDPRNFNPDDKPLTRLLASIGVNLKTFVVKTGGGGIHVYLRKPPDISVVNALKEYPGIEFKSVGRQVVGPGSVHPETGKVYEVLAGAPNEIMEAPQALLELIRKTAIPYSEIDGKGTGAYQNDPMTQGQYRAYLQDVAEVSVEGKNGDNQAFKVAAHGRDLGLPPAVTFELMLSIWNERCQPPWGEEELKVKVVNAYRYAAGPLGGSSPAAVFSPVPPVDGGTVMTMKSPAHEEITWALTKQGGIVKNFFNLLNFIKLPSAGLHNVFGYNEFTGVVEIVNPAPWHKGIMPRGSKAVQDIDLKLLKGHLAVHQGFEAMTGIIEEAVSIVAHSNKFHPVREYLLSLKWDGVPRIDTWLTDFGGAEDSAYTRACARKVLCAAVKRIMKPGCKFDHVLVLEGEQGIGKSGICRILGGEWSGDFSVDPHNKDTIQLLQGRWIVELAELEVSKRSESDAVKAFLTRETDAARLAYGRLVAEFPRQSIFIATKNPGPDGTYLKDETGNRRWWPVELNPQDGIVNFAALKAARNQLFAEAVQKVRGGTEGGHGEKLYMDTEELREESAKHASRRHAEEAWTERIGAWVADQSEGRDFLLARDIYIEGLGGTDKGLDRLACVRIARAMRAVGWIPGFKREKDGRFMRGYRKHENSLRGKRKENSELGDLV